MLVSPDFMAYANRKDPGRAPKRSLVEAAMASSPGEGRKKPAPVNLGEAPKERPNREEVDYLNARASTLDVVL
jgi:hypothetical protein